MVESFGSPEVRDVFEELKSLVPNSQFVINILNEESSQKIAEAKQESKLWFPQANDFKNVLDKILSKRFNPLRLFFIRKKIVKRQSLNYPIQLCEEFIKVGFNRAPEQEKGIYKITAYNSPSMVTVTLIMALGESRGMKIKKEGGGYFLKMNGKYYDITNFVSPKTNDRGHRLLTKSFKRSGYSLKHGDKVVQVAERWYGCRVTYSGIEEYCDKMERNEELDPANISNEIKECDEAMGYPRGKN